MVLKNFKQVGNLGNDFINSTGVSQDMYLELENVRVGEVSDDAFLCDGTMYLTFSNFEFDNIQASLFSTSVQFRGPIKNIKGGNVGDFMGNGLIHTSCTVENIEIGDCGGDFTDSTTDHGPIILRNIKVGNVTGNVLRSIGWLEDFEVGNISGNFSNTSDTNSGYHRNIKLGTVNGTVYRSTYNASTYYNVINNFYLKNFEITKAASIFQGFDSNKSADNLRFENITVGTVSHMFKNIVVGSHSEVKNLVMSGSFSIYSNSAFSGNLINSNIDVSSFPGGINQDVWFAQHAQVERSKIITSTGSKPTFGAVSNNSIYSVYNYAAISIIPGSFSNVVDSDITF
jgi:hypothetical protein